MGLKSKEIINTHYGIFNTEEAQEIIFPDGLLGFRDCKRYFLIKDKMFKYFNLLQYSDDLDIFFIIINKDFCYPEYQTNYFFLNITTLELEHEKFLGKCSTYFIANHNRENINETTINLKGPLIINNESGKGIQVISMNEQFKTDQNLSELIETNKPFMSKKTKNNIVPFSAR